MGSRRIGRIGWILLLGLAVIPACIIVREVKVAEVNRTSDSVRVRSPVKAHLIDGTTVVYSQGVILRNSRLLGSGTRYDLTLGNPVPVTDLSLDSVIGLESFRTQVNNGATFAYSTLTVVGVFGAAVGIACAIDPKCFGSCPTYYSDSLGTPVLEAEGFSYSIAPLFEARDVDRLRARPDTRGFVRLEVRNEAFETHYINHLELLEATHRPGAFIAPDPAGSPVAVSAQVSPRAAVDRTGRNVIELVATADGRTYATDSSVLAGIVPSDLEDWIEFRFDAGVRSDSSALVLRLRNSLLNTVLLYDVMLGDPGARSLDWQHEHLAKVGPALELGAWYAAKMGMTVELRQGGNWIPVTRVKDSGPVAWKDIAIPLPPVSEPEIRVRVRFAADNWRIDRVALGVMERPEVRTLPVAHLTGLTGSAEPEALASVAGNDQRYLQTQAGQGFIAEWNVGTASDGRERTFLLASQGYYTEWVRRGWIAAARDTTTFRPSDVALHRAIVRWTAVQDTLEPKFFATRVPVR
jgi:hypothetical protein